MESDGESLKKVFNFNVAVFSPTSSVLTRDDFEEFGRVLVPTAKGFDDERLEKDPLSPAVVEVRLSASRWLRQSGMPTLESA